MSTVENTIQEGVEVPLLFKHMIAAAIDETDDCCVNCIGTLSDALIVNSLPSIRILTVLLKRSAIFKLTPAI